MRLLRASTLTLHDFVGDEVPQYAIMSHAWGTDEVSLADFMNGSGKQQRGYSKIEQCCAQATLDGFEFVVSFHLLFSDIVGLDHRRASTFTDRII
jgi:hypothetical protein